MRIWVNCLFERDGLSMPSHMSMIQRRLSLDGIVSLGMNCGG